MRRARASRVDPAASAAERRELFALAARGELHWHEAVRRMRLALGKTQAEFGELFGLSRQQVVKIENATANPTIKMLNRLGRPFGLSVGFVPRESAKPAATESSSVP